MGRPFLVSLVFVFGLASALMSACAARAAPVGDCVPEPSPQFVIPEDLPRTGRVAEVVDADTVELESGREVRLVGLQGPKLSLGRAGVEDWPRAKAAKAALAELVGGREVRIAFGGRPVDRHQRLLAHLYVSDEGTQVWVQGTLLAGGWARVYTFSDNRACAREMLARERAARAASRGIWSHRFYRVRRPAETERLVGSFQLVEGRVQDAARVRGRVYLNFGPDWRTDFTISVSPDDDTLFVEKGIDLVALKGQLVRVRGWLIRYNGPMIELTHPEALEVLDVQAGSTEQD